MIRSFLRRVVPPAVRRFGREFVREAPVRLRDFAPDFLDFVMRPIRRPLPPARMRRSVALSSSRSEFLSVGSRLWTDLAAAFEAARAPAGNYLRWLDFGCGAGRVARLARDAEFVGDLTGVDVDGRAIAWAVRNLRGATFRSIDPEPPTEFSDASFDVIYAVSVFTHFDREAQLAWLAEMRRLLRVGGLFLASTHSPKLLYARPDVAESGRRELDETGFLFARGGGAFNDDSAFHSRSYLEQAWGEFFRLRFFREHGLAGYQDLSVWER